MAVALGAMLPMAVNAATVYWKANDGGDITVASNWNTASDGSGADVEPQAGDTLDFSKITTSGKTLIGSFDGDPIFAGAKFALDGANYVTLAGSLHFQSLSNANHLAVASTGLLTVEENLLWDVKTAQNESSNRGRLLHQIDGTVNVKGVAYAKSGHSSINCDGYQTRVASSSPLRVGGIEYQSGGFTFAYRLTSYEGTTASWIVGSQGMFFYPGSSGSSAKNCFVVDGANATLYSQADWSIGTSGNSRGNSVADLYIDDKTLTIDTKDYDNNSMPRTVTLNGRVYSSARSGIGLDITGNGKFVIATKDAVGKETKTRIHNTLAVSDTATLQINEDAEYAITNVTFASGTTLALPNSTAGSFVTRSIESVTLPASGTVNLVIDGATLSPGTYTLLSCVPANYGNFKVSGTAVSGKVRTLTDNGSALQLVVIGGERVFWNKNAGGDIISSSNWTNSLGEAVVPQVGDTLDFSAITTTEKTLTGSFSDDRIFTGATFALTGNNNVWLSGSLHFQSLNDANHLRILSGGSLVVEENLKWSIGTAINENNNMGRLLQQNDGTVVVKGLAWAFGGYSNKSGYCYETRGASGIPLRVGGIQYQCGGFQFGFYLHCYGNNTASGPGWWIVGSDGMTFYPGGTGDNAKNCFIVGGGNKGGGDVTLSSQADWSIGTSGNANSFADIYIDGKTLTIDTKDYDDNTVPRTVTLNGRVYAPSTSGTSLSITGNGTFKVATSVTSGNLKYTCISNTVAVADTATLQLDEGASYQIANVSLAAGTTLALPNSTAASFVTRSIESMTLPASGTVNLVIDGPVLPYGDYTILSCVPDNYRNFAVSGTALGGHPARLSADGSSLKLTIHKRGFIISVF